MNYIWGELLWLAEKHISRRFAFWMVGLPWRVGNYLPRIYRTIRLVDGQRGIVIRPPYAWFGVKYALRLTMPWKAPRRGAHG